MSNGLETAVEQPLIAGPGKPGFENVPAVDTLPPLETLLQTASGASLSSAASGRRRGGLAQLFGIWGILPAPLGVSVDALVARALAGESASGGAERCGAAADDDDSDLEPDYYEMLDSGICRIDVIGPLSKYGSYYFGGSSLRDIVEAANLAAADERVSKVLLLVDSPGGTVSGTKEAADAVRALAAVKPVYGYFQDMACSAAYWIGSQCTRIFGNSTLLTASIGTYTVAYDYSEAFEEAKIKAILIGTGKFKGAGTFGTKVTAEQVAQWQGLIDGLNEHFLKGVAEGRGLALRAVRNLADGAAMLAADAVETRLIDGIATLDETVAALRGARKIRSAAGTAGATSSDDGVTWWIDLESVQPTTNNQSPITNLEESDMSTATAPAGAANPAAPAQNAPANAAAVSTLLAGTATFKGGSATLEDLEQACPGAGAEFYMAQLRNKATVEQANRAWNVALKANVDDLAAKLVAANKQIGDLKAEIAGEQGIKPLGDGTQGSPATPAIGGGSDPVAEFNAAVQAKIAASGGKLSKAEAIAAVSVENEKLHDEYIAANNEAVQKRRKRRE